MNILYITTSDPRLKNTGSEQRTNLLGESLKRYGRVYTFQVRNHVGNEAEMIEGEHPIYRFRPIINRYSFWHFFNSIINRLTPFNPWNRKTVIQPVVANVFKGIKFDLVVSRYIYPLFDYKYWEIAPLLIDIDDHPYQVYETIYKNRVPLGLKAIGKYLTKVHTNYIINKSAGGWIANEEQLHLCGKNYGFLPNIPLMPSEKYNVDYNSRNNLFTVGDMGYKPNKDGVTTFLTQVWPLFHQKHPNVSYYIAGKGASEAETKLWSSYEGVKYLGFVEDLEALYEKTLATVVPIYSGGGTCIKTLESMAYSRPCISTPFGARGISNDVIQDEKGILLFEGAESFIQAYEKLIDKSYCHRIETNGKAVLLSRYSVNAFNDATDKVVKTVINM